MTQQTTTQTATGELLPYVYDDGGRAHYFKGKVGVADCVCRAIAIASGKDYKEVYNAVTATTGKSARRSQDTKTAKFKRFMAGMGFTWTPCSGIGVRMAVHARKGELPEHGRMVCSAAGHWFAVVEGVVHDVWDSRFNSWGEVRRIYGYWTYNEPKNEA